MRAVISGPRSGISNRNLEVPDDTIVLPRGEGRYSASVDAMVDKLQGEIPEIEPVVRIDMGLHYWFVK